MAKPRIERALGYVRVSTQRQADGVISLDHQESRLRAYYTQRRIKLIKIYRDDGRSGTSDNRPGLQALGEHAVASGSCITEIGVDSLSRLFRDRDLLDRYLSQWTLAGVRVVVIDQEVERDAQGKVVGKTSRTS